MCRRFKSAPDQYPNLTNQLGARGSSARLATGDVGPRRAEGFVPIEELGQRFADQQPAQFYDIRRWIAAIDALRATRPAQHTLVVRTQEVRPIRDFGAQRMDPAFDDLK